MKTKRSIFFFLLLLGAYVTSNAQQQMNNYIDSWKQVEQLYDKGLNRSALQQVDKIYQAARREKNQPQLIKSMLFKINLAQPIEENYFLKSIDSLEKESTELTGAAWSLMQSITAQMYWNYFQQNRYKLYDRTNTENYNKDDIATWTIDDLHRKIGELYLASLQNDAVLKNTKLEKYDAIILKGNVRYMRPTLYDLLAHRALDYFKNDERTVTRPAYAFEITDTMALAPAASFARHDFKTADTTSLHYRALVIFQQLLSFHANDSKPDALIDANIERLMFVHSYARMADKDERYIDAMQNIYTKYKSESAAQAGFLAAAEVYQNASQNAKTDTTASYTISKAKAMLDNIINAYPKSEGGINAQNLLQTIMRKDLDLTVEKVNVPGEPFRILVNFKNVQQVFFRLIPADAQLNEFLEERGENKNIFKRLATEKYIRQWQQSLPVTSDYLPHAVEVKSDGLPPGSYVLLSSTGSDFNPANQVLAAQYFHVSNISFVSDGSDYFMLNRNSGKPLAGAAVQVWYQSYNYKTRKNQLKKGPLLTANKNGFISLPEPKDTRNERQVRLEINYQSDRLFLEDYQYRPYLYNAAWADTDEYKNQAAFDKDQGKIFLFTDRSLYRPGQKVYFKGIGVTESLKTKKPVLLYSKDSLLVVLSDTNGQQVDSARVMLNEYGSFSGLFKLPEGKLNGEFDIDVREFTRSSVSISVEEYKRPKFYTEIEKPKSSYRVGDTVSVQGFAKAYAGNQVDGAAVTYRVTRVARFLYPWMFWRKGFPQSRSMEIAHGDTVTDANGSFSIRFAAIPDLSIDPANEPVFDYKIVADVTDINGETRSNEIIVPVGYKALNLQILLPGEEAINKDSLRNIVVSSKNLSGEDQPTVAGLKIYLLLPPQRLIRERLWAAPDLHIMEKEEFIQFFPHDEYDQEKKVESWPLGKIVFDKTDSISDLKAISLGGTKLGQGWYVAEATAQDPYGQTVTTKKYFQVYDPNSAAVPAPTYLWTHVSKNNLQPGETFSVTTGTSADELYMIRAVNKNKQTAVDKKPNYVRELNHFTVKNGKDIFNLKISEEDRGGFGMQQFFVKNNRFYVVDHSIRVPWTNKQLHITFDTYRDKTLPGSEEKWKVKISGAQGDKIAAEMLASMYDASLDQFKPHDWNQLDVWPEYSGYNQWQAYQNFTTVHSFGNYRDEKYIPQKEKIYDVLNYLPQYHVYDMMRQSRAMEVSAAPQMNKEMNEVVVKGLAGKVAGVQVDSTVAFGEENDAGVSPDPSLVQVRKNFNETAFFFPELKTDSAGNIEFSFTMPEALTQWKLMTLAHTKDLASGYTERTVITQKDLMVQPNPPRFLREGDQMEFSAKIVNMTEKEVTGNAELQLLNATTMNPVDGWFKNIFPVQYFTAAAGQSTLVNFNIEVPNNFNEAVVYRIIARAGNTSDGEEAALPVVTNRMLVTETMPLPLRGDTTKNFKFEKLSASANSETLTQYGLTVEYTTNPAWYAVQALPYLMEYPYECTEQNFNRFYANALAHKIVGSSPKIKAIFDKWRHSDTSALMSNLQKNEELKSVMLQETPWVLQATSESQQKKNIALLFDMVKMSNEMEATLAKLADMQSPNGGFVWFKGGQDNRYITQYIITGIGHLKNLNAYPSATSARLDEIVDKALPYLDARLKDEYDQLLKHKADLKNNQLSAMAVQYLYMRSFYPHHRVSKESQKAYDFFTAQAKKYWLSQNKYLQGMIALALHRNGDQKLAGDILASLKENAINNEDLGMYWKDWDKRSYWWYQAPIESQALMIEVFSEIGKDENTVDDLKTWLLKNKQTNNWESTKATAEAVYALLLRGTDWLTGERNVTVKLGGLTLSNKDENSEAGTGYFKRRIDGNRVKPAMGDISVTVSSEGKNENTSASWGAIYWQYFENLDKISFAETPLRLAKKLFVEKNTDKGPVLVAVNEGDQLHIGDKIKVRIELRADRDMEYVHMKDMRASCMEPVNVISGYKYQGGLGYYESTKDVSTNFFFAYLPKGTYVFEYPMFVTHSGDFSNGITTIQCMYAPEFTAHSEGLRVKVVAD